jgi:hypothetical protein
MERFHRVPGRARCWPTQGCQGLSRHFPPLTHVANAERPVSDSKAVSCSRGSTTEPRSHLRCMDLKLSDQEIATLAVLLRRTIADDRYPLSPRVRELQSILDRIEPPPVREPLPPLRHYAPPRAKASRRRG